MVTKEEIKGLDLQNFAEFCEHLEISLINGNKSYVKETLSRMSPKQLTTFLSLTNTEFKNNFITIKGHNDE